MVFFEEIKILSCIFISMDNILSMPDKNSYGIYLVMWNSTWKIKNVIKNGKHFYYFYIFSIYDEIIAIIS